MYGLPKLEAKNMGEKIRDLNSVTFGQAELMIELNEGYTKEEGRVIHVQNPHFRYLIDEQGFLDLATTILRAREEMYYFKDNNKNESSRENDMPVINDYSLTQKKIINELSYHNYRVIENTESLLSIIVNPSERKHLHEFFDSHSSYVRLEHPFSKKFGFIYLYQMHEFELYKMGSDYIEVFYELPSYSLTPNTWMPLDKKIQKHIWGDGQGIELGEIDFYIYKLAYAIFWEHKFTKKTIEHLKMRQHVLDDDLFKELLQTVFFKYSSRLIEKLQDNEFSQIINDYFSFLDY